LTGADDEENESFEPTYTDEGPDPTLPFTVVEHSLVRFDGEVVTRWSDALRREFVAIFVSESQQLARSAVAEVAQHGAFSRLQKRVLQIGPGDELPQPTKLARIKLGEGGETLVVVAADGENGKFFMRSFLWTYVNSLKGELRRSRRFVAVGVTPEMLVEDAKLRWDQLPCFHLPFLQTYLRAIDAPDLEDTVLRQKQAGLWGEPSRASSKRSSGCMNVAISRVESRLGNGNMAPNRPIKALNRSLRRPWMTPIGWRLWCCTRQRSFRT
jgi:hypothetical protein